MKSSCGNYRMETWAAPASCRPPRPPCPCRHPGTRASFPALLFHPDNTGWRLPWSTLPGTLSFFFLYIYTIPKSYISYTGVTLALLSREDISKNGYTFSTYVQTAVKMRVLHRSTSQCGQLFSAFLLWCMEEKGQLRCVHFLCLTTLSEAILNPWEEWAHHHLSDGQTAKIMLLEQVCRWFKSV